MAILRVILKIMLLPFAALFGLAALLTRASIKVGCFIAGFLINICLIMAVVNLISHQIPAAIISLVIILVIVAILFIATNVELLFDWLRSILWPQRG